MGPNNKGSGPEIEGALFPYTSDEYVITLKFAQVAAKVL